MEVKSFLKKSVTDRTYQVDDTLERSKNKKIRCTQYIVTKKLEK